jgi:hypothetical protein
MTIQPRRLAGIGFCFLSALFAADVAAQWPAVVDLSSERGGAPVVVFNGVAAGDFSGVRFAGAGDVNGDGVEDFLVGASFARPTGTFNQGAAYLIYGGPDVGASGAFSLASLDGTNGVVIAGLAEGDDFGTGLRGAGDVNGDGLSDFLAGSYLADPNGFNEAGEGYLIYGVQGGLPHVGGLFDLASLDGTNGVVLEGFETMHRSNFTLSGAGDVNGDGFDDIVVCGYRRDEDHVGNPKKNTGEAYLLYGSASGVAHAAGRLDLSSLDGENGVAIRGVAPGDLTGDDVSGAGDVNGDGYADLIVNAYQADRFGRIDCGAAWIVHGAAGGLPHVGGVFDLDTINGANGTQIVGAAPGDFTGDKLSGLGDANGDGYADVIVGVYRADAPGAMDRGRAVVLFGSASGVATSGGALDLGVGVPSGRGTLLEGVEANDWTGFAVGAAGDIDGDGFFDALVGAPMASPGGVSMAGSAFLLFGGPSGLASADTIFLSLLNGANGVRFNGAAAEDFAASHVESAGDFNADGVCDFAFGADKADLPGMNQVGATYLVFGQTAAAAATYRAFAAPGNAPRLGVGLVGNGLLATPASRLWIDFDDGAGPASGASLVEVELHRSDAAIAGLPNAPAETADVLWRLQTNRANWTTAEVSLRYVDGEMGSLDEQFLRVFQAPAPTGPWTIAPTTELRIDRNLIRCSIENGATFAGGRWLALLATPTTAAHGWLLYGE